MSQTIVRLQGLELRNIKNVEFGKIEMPNSYQNERRYNNSEILGLYGQNGSGKTAVIDTMYFLQKFMTGESIEKKLTDYINMKKESAELKASFIIFEDNIMYDGSAPFPFLCSLAAFIAWNNSSSGIVIVAGQIANTPLAAS